MNHYEHEIIADDTSLQLNFKPIRSVNGYSPLHWHSHLEVILILDGYLTAFVSEKKYTLKRDDMLVINPGELHSTRGFGEVTYLLLQIPRDYLDKATDQSSLLHFQTYFPFITRNSTQKKLCECLLQLLEIYTKKEDGYQLYFSSVTYCFLYILYRNHSEKITRERKEEDNRNLERIEETIRYIKNNYRRDISLEEASGLVHISPEYFCRLFKKYTGQTLGEYVNAVRMLHFYHDLALTSYSVGDLMEQNGIRNYKAFIRLFKETYHTTPAKLRKKLREGQAQGPNPD